MNKPLTRYLLKPEVVAFIKQSDQLIVNLSAINKVSYSTIRINWLYDEDSSKLTNKASLDEILSHIQQSNPDTYTDIDSLLYAVPVYEKDLSGFVAKDAVRNGSEL